MRLAAHAFCLCLPLSFANAQMMILNEPVYQDPVRLQLCNQRSHVGDLVGPRFPNVRITSVPFEINPNFLASTRALYPDATFIVIENGMSSQLVVCAANGGAYRPITGGAEATNQWSLVRPQQAPNALGKAVSVCLDAAPSKINQPNFYRAASRGPASEVNIGNGLFPPGTMVGQVKAERFDFAVRGVASYKTSGPDQININFTCLLFANA